MPVVCGCVVQNGGIAPDGLRQFAGRVEQQLLDGTFATQLAADLQRLPIEAREPARLKLRERLAAPGMTPSVHAAIEATLGALDADPEYLTRPCAPPTLPADAGAGENHVDAPV